MGRTPRVAVRHMVDGGDGGKVIDWIRCALDRNRKYQRNSIASVGAQFNLRQQERPLRTATESNSDDVSDRWLPLAADDWPAYSDFRIVVLRPNLNEYCLVAIVDGSNFEQGCRDIAESDMCLSLTLEQPEHGRLIVSKYEGRQIAVGWILGCNSQISRSVRERTARLATISFVPLHTASSTILHRDCSRF